jgi:hypothetical protein
MKKDECRMQEIVRRSTRDRWAPARPQYFNRLSKLTFSAFNPMSLETQFHTAELELSGPS